MPGWIEPMLARPMHKDVDLETGDWFAEEKYDGHRLCVRVGPTNVVTCWTRLGNVRLMPPHVRVGLLCLPPGCYDGELVAKNKQKSYGVTELINQDQLQLVLFDILEVNGLNAMDCTYTDRRTLLEELRKHLSDDAVVVAPSFALDNKLQMEVLAQACWDRGGEGLILKHKDHMYIPKKRTKAWVKIKQLHSSVLTVVGFVEGKMGPHATVLLEDDEGNQTTVKTKNTRELKHFAQHARESIGRKLRIEFQERTPDGSYRHPRWDRWEDE